MLLSVFNIFMSKYLKDLRALFIAEYLRPQERVSRKDDLAQSMSTGEMTLKHTKLRLVFSRRANSGAPPEVTLLLLSQSVILFWHFAFFGASLFFSLNLKGAAELSDIHDFQGCAK